jgi:hypothetical protein
MTSSRTRLGRCALGIGAVLLVGLLPAPAAVATPFHFKEFAQGAVVSWTTCPEDDPPSVPTVCHDYTVYYARFDSTAGEGSVGSLDRSGEPFVAQYEDFAYLFVPDGEGVDISLRYGSSADVVGFYDKTHLTRAGMSGATLQLIDVDLETGTETATGSTVALGEFSWTAESPVYRYGNDGPVFDGRQHVSDACQTFNADAHQRFTLGSVTGSVDGVPLSDEATIPQVPDLEPTGAPGGIFDNWFRIVDVSKRC